MGRNLVLILLLGGMMLCDVGRALGLEEKLPRARSLYFASATRNVFEAIPVHETSGMEELFSRLLTGDFGTDVCFKWRELGFSLQPADQQGQMVWALTDAEGRGRGFYLFRDRALTGGLLMMPHRYADADTGRIGLAMFEEGNFSVAAWNTTHRYEAGQGDARGLSDFAHRQNSPFTALTRSFARVFPNRAVIQIHGYANGHRKERAGRSSDVIVSAGGLRPDWLPPLGRCLESAGMGTVLTYPDQVSELGGTTNVSGRILRSMGLSSFVHVEMNRDVRTRLLEESDLRKDFITCLSGVRP